METQIYFKHRHSTLVKEPFDHNGLIKRLKKGISRRPRVVAYRGDEMWSEGRYDYERLPRERVPPRSHPSDGYRRVVNVVPKKPPLLDRPGEGSYNRYYSHVDYRDYDEGRSFSHDRRSGPPHRGVCKFPPCTNCCFL